MKRFYAFVLAAGVCCCFYGKEIVTSPDGKMEVTLQVERGRMAYSVAHDGKLFVLPSSLGLVTDFGDLTQGLTLKEVRHRKVAERYNMTRSKTSKALYEANIVEADVENGQGQKMTVEFSVGNSDVAFRYHIPQQQGHRASVIKSEMSCFRLPNGTTTFLCPQTAPMTGWERTKPSYEEDYTADAQMNVRSRDGEGFSLPCLFHLGETGWLMVSETGVAANYCASHLSDYDGERGYSVAYPAEGENNGVGITGAAVGLPAYTPWRTLTLGPTLKPVVETTVMYDLVKPLYEPHQTYKPGRYVWSWLLWQDASMNWDDQVRFVDLAAVMGYEYVLVDALWDEGIGRDRMPELVKYAEGKGVGILLWYNSNGAANDAPQSPRNVLNTPTAREREMAWLEKIGVKGMKIDFFGGDKQETMAYYEALLSDADRHGLQVIFHGCTIPRGWERMFPNYVASEACLASENLYFEQRHCDAEGFELTIHPFLRNAIGSMDWGGTIMNKRMSCDNQSRHFRRTGDVFEMASAIMNQSSLNCIAIYPNNLDELPADELEWLKTVPTTWDETRFIDGYPGRYAVLARRHGSRWYIAALNGTNEPIKLTLQLPMLAGQKVDAIIDQKQKSDLPQGEKKQMSVSKSGIINITLPSLGGGIIEGNDA